MTPNRARWGLYVGRVLVLFVLVLHSVGLVWRYSFIVAGVAWVLLEAYYAEG